MKYGPIQVLLTVRKIASLDETQAAEVQDEVQTYEGRRGDDMQGSSPLGLQIISSSTRQTLVALKRKHRELCLIMHQTYELRHTQSRVYEVQSPLLGGASKLVQLLFTACILILCYPAVNIHVQECCAYSFACTHSHSAL